MLYEVITVHPDPQRLHVLEPPEFVQFLLEIGARRKRLPQFLSHFGLRLDQDGEILPQEGIQQLGVPQEVPGKELV